MEAMTEVWKDIEGYEGEYQVSNKGKVRSLKKWDINKRLYLKACKILKPTDNGKGYLIVGLRKKGKRKNYYVHRLVAEAFVDKIDGKNYVNHINYDTTDNTVDNLEWCTQKENVIHSSKNMRHRKSVSHTNTGEMYIHKRKANDKYRVRIDKKEYGSYESLKEAIKIRDSIIKKGVV